jgi:hypothetical protein
MAEAGTRFDPAVMDAVGREREVELTTWGRISGKPSKKILWAYTDGEKIFIRSGGGLGRDWPRNALARGAGILHVGGLDVPVRLRHVTDIAAARAAGKLARAKYGAQIQVTQGDEEPTLGESATFELTPGGSGRVA